MFLSLLSSTRQDQSENCFAAVKFLLHFRKISRTVKTISSDHKMLRPSSFLFIFTIREGVSMIGWVTLVASIMAFYSNGFMFVAAYVSSQDTLESFLFGTDLTDVTRDSEKVVFNRKTFISNQKSLKTSLGHLAAALFSKASLRSYRCC